MQTDEDRIRQFVIDWIEASRSGDVDTVLNMVADDVVFLMPGRAPMYKAEFGSTSMAQASGGPKIDVDSVIQEIKVAGDWAFMWTLLSVTATPAGGVAIERSGHTLTILKREQGRWLLARDANMLSPIARPNF